MKLHNQTAHPISQYPHRLLYLLDLTLQELHHNEKHWATSNGSPTYLIDVCFRQAAQKTGFQLSNCQLPELTAPITTKIKHDRRAVDADPADMVGIIIVVRLGKHPDIPGSFADYIAKEVLIIFRRSNELLREISRHLRSEVA